MTVPRSRIYVFDYDANEIVRIEWQQQFLTECAGGNLFPPYINAKKLENIADVATGTGAWLRDVSNLLGSQTAEGKPRSYYGFDINKDPFAPALKEKEGIHHIVHDMKTSFPAEHHGKFQLVHVRLVFTFLEELIIPTVFNHLSALLAPGGYLVWTEVDPLHFEVNIPSPRHREIIHITPNHAQKLKRCTNIPKKLRELTGTDMEFASQTTFRPLVLKTVKEMQYYEFMLHRSILQNAYLQMDSELSLEDAKKRADGELEELKVFFENGEAWDLLYNTVAFRKVVKAST